MIHEKSLTKAWVDHLKFIKNKGSMVKPGGMVTLEVLNKCISFDMNYPFINHPNRKINKKFRAAEAYFICHGDNRTENIAQYNKNYRRFSDDGYIMNGSYGPPFNEQVMYVVNTLRQSLHSRQAVLTIWKQNPVESVDIRCTLAIQFMIRDGFLNTFVTMRSSDAIYGLCYDCTVFTMMTLKVLTLINIVREEGDYIALGNMHLTAGSAHVYERHFGLVQDVLTCPVSGLSTQQKVPDNWLHSWIDVVDWLHGEMGK